MKLNGLTVVLILAVIGLIIPGTVSAKENPDIDTHDISVTILPTKNSMLTVDHVTLTAPSNGTFKFLLSKNLEISRVRSKSGYHDFDTGPYVGPTVDEEGFAEDLLEVILYLPRGEREFTINYSGVISDPIEPSKALGRVRGDMTSGIISEDGVYLSSGTGWYPKTDTAMSTYRVRVNIPGEWYAVTQGNLISRERVGSRRESVWDSDKRYDGLALIANRFSISTRNIGGVDCSTYFLEDDPELSGPFLDALEEYLPAYIELFGDYPYNRFDVVENFFSTGYGMPGFTLLGPRVLRMPYATLEGSLAHELVHCWWGNYVFPDWDNGNWCEGLTYFATNYYWNVLSGNDTDARDFRYNDMQKYTLQVSPESEYPLREFRMKMTAEDGNIGYGKAAGVFGMIHQFMGKDDFFLALRLVIERHGGQSTDWDDFQVIFEEVSGKELSGFFDSWLDNAGTPAPRFNSIELTEEQGHYKVDIEILQEGDVFEFPLQVAVDLAEGGPAMIEFWMGSDLSNVSFALPTEPMELIIDPDYRVFRRLNRNEIAPCLNYVLAADSILVILPGGGDDEMLTAQGYGPPREVSIKELYRLLSDTIIASGADVRVKYDTDVTESDLSSSSIICLGSREYNSVTAEIIGKGNSAEVSLLDSGFNVDGEDYTSDANATLLSIRNPYNDDYDVTFYMGNSPAAAARVEFIFHYGNWSYVIFENNQPIARGKWPFGGGPLKEELNIL